MKKTTSKFLLFFSCAALAMGTISSASATEDARVEHYEGEAIVSVEQARTVLSEKVEAISELVKQGKLDDAKMESIHEMTYTLEHATDKLIAEKAAPMKNLEDLDEAVQAIHYASENHEAEKVQEWLTKLDNRVDNLDSDIQAVAPAAGDAKEKKTEYTIVIKDHKFSPEQITVPAGEKIKLIVDNQDGTPEEFESHDMNREKIIAGNKQATIFVGPLKPGKYHYFGEFNMDTANGYVIAE